MCLIFHSCNKHNCNHQTFTEFKNYVSTHSDSIENYYDREWKDMDKEYNDRKILAENSMDEWTVEMKAEFLELQSDWESFHEDHSAEKARRDEILKTDKINNVLPEGIDEGLSNVNGKNILEVYRHLVTYVEQHRKELTHEQWRQIELLWERLGKRLTHVKKNLSGSVMAAIDEQKIRYDVIKAMDKPVATMEETPAEK